MKIFTLDYLPMPTRAQFTTRGILVNGEVGESEPKASLSEENPNCAPPSANASERSERV